MLVAHLLPNHLVVGRLSGPPQITHRRVVVVVVSAPLQAVGLLHLELPLLLQLRSDKARVQTRWTPQQHPPAHSVNRAIR
jgi:hypothetical protein